MIKMCLVRCNWCMNTFDESEIILTEGREEEVCPYCNEIGYLMDLDTTEAEG